jgi:hypothetical protein
MPGQLPCVPIFPDAGYQLSGSSGSWDNDVTKFMAPLPTASSGMACTAKGSQVGSASFLTQVLWQRARAARSGRQTISLHQCDCYTSRLCLCASASCRDLTCHIIA